MGRPPRNLREQIESQMIHNFILGLIGPLKKDDFEYIIKNNIDLISMFASQYDFSNNPMANNILNIIKKNKNRIDEYLNRDSMLEQISDHRPDIYDVFNTPEGIKYLDNMILKIKKLLFQIIR